MHEHEVERVVRDVSSARSLWRPAFPIIAFESFDMLETLIYQVEVCVVVAVRLRCPLGVVARTNIGKSPSASTIDLSDEMQLLQVSQQSHNLVLGLPLVREQNS